MGENDPGQKASPALLGFASHAWLPPCAEALPTLLRRSRTPASSLAQNPPPTAPLQFLGPPGAALAPVRPPHAPAFWTAHLPSLLML